MLTNAVRYADAGQGPVADVLDAARRLVPVDPRRAPLDSGERWLKDARAMTETAERIASAAGLGKDAGARLLAETRRTADACVVDPEDHLGLGSVHFPEPELVGAGRRTAQRVLASRAAAGMVLRGYDRRRDYWERMHQELDVIAYHGFASYFLTVAQVVDDVREMKVRVAARGSGAGSLVNHLLGIAHADPVEHGLLMERFLSRRRFVLPDIDIDVESARRLDVYRAIIERFGTERVATVAMPETYRVRHAIRDVGAALSMDPAETDRLAKAFPHIRARDARAAMEELPELREVAREKGRYGRLWELVEALDALPRGIAMHPCGVLLSDATLLRRVPTVPTSGDGFPMVQFDKEDVEDLGLLKLDVLGVRMQSAMAHAVTEIGRASGQAVDLDAVEPDDPETYRMIRSAETLGCFQIESPGQRDLVGRLQPRLSTIWWSTSRCSAPDRSPPTWCGRSSRPGTAGPRALPAPRSGRAAARDVRGGRLPRADHRDGRHHDRLRPGRGRPGAARALRPRIAGPDQDVVRAAGDGEGLRRRSDGPHLGDHRGVRQLRLLQGARGRLRRTDVPVGLAQGAPPGGLLRRAAHP